MKCFSVLDTRLIVIFAVCVQLGTVSCVRRPELRVTTYVTDAVGLREGAPVRVQGVELGQVTVVRVRPQQGRPPVEIEMVLRPAYELHIPSDAKVRLETAGVLGPVFAKIDVVGASGPALRNGGVLQAEEVPRATLEQLVNKLAQSIQNPCEGEHPSGPAVPSSPSASRQKAY